jgi:hypothetical protein
MSCNRESVAWQSKDKTWSLGFYSYTPHGSEADGYDYEWDVEYDYNNFHWVSTGHKLLQEAVRAGGRLFGNTGSPQVLTWDKENQKEIANCEEMALWHTSPEQAKLNLKNKEAKLRREHTAKLKEKFAENNDFKGCRVMVTLKLDDATYTRMGASQSTTDYARVDGDWLMVGKVQVKNMKTGRLNRKLHEITVQRELSYGYGYGRW